MSSILNLGLIKEREEVLEIMIRIDKDKNGIEGAESRIKEEIKGAVSSSVGLRDCIKSLSNKFPWSDTKAIFMTTISFFKEILMGWGFYTLDIVTDVLFVHDMFSLAKKNFNQTTSECKEEFAVKFSKANVLELCDIQQFNFSGQACKDSLIDAREHTQCFENEQRFEDTNNWIIAGTVSTVHCFLPLIFAFFVWGFLIRAVRCGKAVLAKLPLTFVTKTYMFICQKRLHNNYAWKGRNKDKKSVARFETEKEAILDQISAQENIVNLSKIIESSFESSFQFFFQTVFLWPTIIITVSNMELFGAITDLLALFDKRTFSILLSFATLAFSFYAIR